MDCSSVEGPMFSIRHLTATATATATGVSLPWGTAPAKLRRVPRPLERLGRILAITGRCPKVTWLQLPTLSARVEKGPLSFTIPHFVPAPPKLGTNSNLMGQIILITELASLPWSQDVPAPLKLARPAAPCLKAPLPLSLSAWGDRARLERLRVGPSALPSRDTAGREVWGEGRGNSSQATQWAHLLVFNSVTCEPCQRLRMWLRASCLSSMCEALDGIPATENSCCYYLRQVGTFQNNQIFGDMKVY